MGRRRNVLDEGKKTSSGLEIDRTNGMKRWMAAWSVVIGVACTGAVYQTIDMTVLEHSKGYTARDSDRKCVMAVIIGLGGVPCAFFTLAATSIPASLPDICRNCNQTLYIIRLKSAYTWTSPEH